jgi:hypothetical protein
MASQKSITFEENYIPEVIIQRFANDIDAYKRAKEQHQDNDRALKTLQTHATHNQQHKSKMSQMKGF